MQNKGDKDVCAPRQLHRPAAVEGRSKVCKLCCCTPPASCFLSKKKNKNLLLNI